MNVAIRATFWVVTFGGLGYALLKVVKPNDDVLKEIDIGSKHTEARKLSAKTIEVLKEASNQSSELNKKIEELIKKGK